MKELNHDVRLVCGCARHASDHGSVHPRLTSLLSKVTVTIILCVTLCDHVINFALSSSAGYDIRYDQGQQLLNNSGY